MSPEVRRDNKVDYSGPKELPTTKKSALVTDSYMPRANDSRLGGRIGDSFQNRSPVKSPRNRSQFEPDRSISEHDDIQALSALLIENTQRRKEEQQINLENDREAFLEENFNKISKSRSVNTKARITQNMATLHNKLDEEHIIDQEIQ